MRASAGGAVRAAIAGAVVAALTTLPGLGVGTLWDNSETAYGEVAREILLTHDWVVMHLNNVPYFVQPPLYFWLGAFFSLFAGPTAFAMRLPSALATIALCAFTGYAVARQAGARVGIYAVGDTLNVLDASRDRAAGDHGRTARPDGRDDDLLVVSRARDRAGSLRDLRVDCGRRSDFLPKARSRPSLRCWSSCRSFFGIAGSSRRIRRRRERGSPAWPPSSWLPHPGRSRWSRTITSLRCKSSSESIRSAGTPASSRINRGRFGITCRSSSSASFRGSRFCRWRSRTAYAVCGRVRWRIRQPRGSSAWRLRGASCRCSFSVSRARSCRTTSRSSFPALALLTALYFEAVVRRGGTRSAVISAATVPITIGALAFAIWLFMRNNRLTTEIAIAVPPLLAMAVAIFAGSLLTALLGRAPRNGQRRTVRARPGGDRRYRRARNDRAAARRGVQTRAAAGRRDSGTAPPWRRRRDPRSFRRKRAALLHASRRASRWRRPPTAIPKATPSSRAASSAPPNARG